MAHQLVPCCVGCLVQERDTYGERQECAGLIDMDEPYGAQNNGRVDTGAIMLFSWCTTVKHLNASKLAVLLKFKDNYLLRRPCITEKLRGV